MSQAEAPGVVSPESLGAIAPQAREESPAAASEEPAATNSSNGQYTSRLLVERWLTDRGVSHRAKAERDGKGRKVYVLKACPFDPSHGDPDSCIMQDDAGKLSAQCFHNSCQGRGWQQFKAAIGAPEAHHYDPPLEGGGRKKCRSAKRSEADAPRGAPPGSPAQADAGGNKAGSGRPRIQANRRQLRDVSSDAHVAVLTANAPPTLFQRGGLLTRLRRRAEGGAPYLEPVTDWALRGHLARVADWFKVRDAEGGTVEEDDAPPLEVVKDLAHLPWWEGVPVIASVAESPIFDRAGRLVATPGFNDPSGIWYEPADGLEIAPLRERPTDMDVRAAKDLLLTELLGDFPFKDDPSRAHALAALLLPFVRAMVDGPTPLHLLDAPTEGTGKTLLASAIGLVATGRPPEAMAEGSCDEEWRKRITAALAEGPTFLLLDNLNRTLDSGALAAALTIRFWKDRILGTSKTATLPVNAVWLASGNNTRLSRELLRRTVWVRLDARVDTPWERKNFRHKNLLGWAKAERGRLVGAALTLVLAWLTAGRPKGTATLGMYESWAETVGGILDVAGVPGLLGNASEFRANRADHVAEWRAFVAAWWHDFQDRSVGVDALFTLATREKLLDSVLGDKGERSQRIRLGIALGKAADRVYGDYRLEPDGEDNKGRQQFRLQPTVGGASTGSSPAPKLNDDFQEWSA
jgi:hypothetical protein